MRTHGELLQELGGEEEPCGAPPCREATPTAERPRPQEIQRVHAHHKRYKRGHVHSAASEATPTTERPRPLQRPPTLKSTFPTGEGALRHQGWTMVNRLVFLLLLQPPPSCSRRPTSRPRPTAELSSSCPPESSSCDVHAQVLHTFPWKL